MMRSRTLAVFSLILFAPPVFAYILPSQFLVRKGAEKRAGDFKGVKLLKLKSKVTVFQDEKPTDLSFKQVLYYSPSVRAIRFAVLDAQDQVIARLERRGEKSGVLDALLFSASTKEIATQFKAKKIPIQTDEDLAAFTTEEEKRSVEKVSFSRGMSTAENRAFQAFVIGEANRMEPQYWAEKETFLPRKLRYAQGSEWIEVQFENYRLAHEKYPRIMNFMRSGGSPVFSKIYEESLNDWSVSADSNEWQSNALPQGKAMGALAWIEPASDSIPGSLREKISRYYEVFR